MYVEVNITVLSQPFNYHICVAILILGGKVFKNSIKG